MHEKLGAFACLLACLVSLSPAAAARRDGWMREEDAGCLGPDKIGRGNKYWHTQELERESWGGLGLVVGGEKQ